MSHGDGDPGDLAGALDAYETAPAIMLACEGNDMVLASANEAARDAFGDRCEFGKPLREIAPEVDQGTMDLMDDMVGTVFATGARRLRVVISERSPTLSVNWLPVGTGVSSVEPQTGMDDTNKTASRKALKWA